MVAKPDEQLPVSGLQALLADGVGAPFTRYSSLEAAREDPEATVVLSGDDGGTVLLTVPLRLVSCGLPELHRLAVELDSEVWEDSTGVEVSILRLPAGSAVPGGMGGGIVIDGIWLHPELDTVLVDHAERVLADPGSIAPE